MLLVAPQSQSTTETAQALMAGKVFFSSNAPSSYPQMHPVQLCPSQAIQCLFRQSKTLCFKMFQVYKVLFFILQTIILRKKVNLPSRSVLYKHYYAVDLQTTILKVLWWRSV